MAKMGFRYLGPKVYKAFKASKVRSVLKASSRPVISVMTARMGFLSQGPQALTGHLARSEWMGPKVRLAQMVTMALMAFRSRAQPEPLAQPVPLVPPESMACRARMAATVRMECPSLVQRQPGRRLVICLR